MSTEYTPFTPNDDNVYYVEIEDDGMLPSFIKNNRFVQYSLASVCGLVVLLLLYFMLIVLPGLAPEGIQIPDIQMVKAASFYLHPIIPDKSKVKNPDPDDPFKTIPNFRNMPYVSEENPALKDHMAKLKHEDVHLTEKQMKKRVILIGDVHGCLTQLKKFLDHVQYDGGRDDHVILLGDFMNKGPNSIGVLNFIMEHNIDCILGNHEIAMMKRYTQFHGLKSPYFINDGDNGNSTFSMREAYDLDDLMRLAKKLTPEHIKFLSAASAIKELGPVPHYVNKKQNKQSDYPAQGLAVHAGLVWSKGVHQQDIEEVTTVRNLLPPDWRTPTEDRHDKVGGVKSIAWTKKWTEHQSKVYEDGLKDLNDQVFTISKKLYYGHDAKRGVVIKEFSNGLDSGCVYGNQLTGVIIWAHLATVADTEKILYKQMVVDVNC